MRERFLVLSTAAIAVILCLAVSQDKSERYRIDRPALLEHDPCDHTWEDALDIAEILENPRKRKEFIGSLHWWPQYWAVQTNAWTMTALSIIERRGYMREVPVKLRTEYYLYRLHPPKKIEGWKDWMRCGSHWDFWVPYTKPERDKIAFGEYCVGGESCGVDGLNATGRDAVPYMIDYVKTQESEGLRVLILVCLRSILSREFILSDFFNESDWRSASSQLKEWWKRAKDFTPEQMARDALADGSILVNMRGAESLVELGDKEGLKALLGILREMVTNYNRFVDGYSRWGAKDSEYGTGGKNRAFCRIERILRNNLESLHGRISWSSNAESRRSLHICEKALKKDYDKLVFDAKEKRFRLPAGK